MSPLERGHLEIREPTVIAAAFDVPNVAHVRAVLREDQFELIRQIVREEIARAKG